MEKEKDAASTEEEAEETRKVQMTFCRRVYSKE